MCRRKLLDQIAGGRLSGRQLVVVSNRGPYVFRSSGRCGEVEQPAGGLVEALRPVVQATGGLVDLEFTVHLLQLRHRVALEHKIDLGDIDLLHLTDDPAEAVRVIVDAEAASRARGASRTVRR